jgi:ubiquinone/menaquinone biosynthesis C-methylase UbiE
LLRDPLLEEFASKAKSCLEIGCGNGANLPLLRKTNSTLKYTGLDNASGAISAAQMRFADDSNAQFVEGDAVGQIDLPSGQFDLVFTKLVLWSIGPTWPGVLAEAFRLLKPGGVFYAFEPCNQFIELQPAKQAAKTWMKTWDESVLNSGLDPYIGTKVSSKLYEAGFSQVGAKFFPVVATGFESEKYLAIVDNLKGFYMGEAASTFGLTKQAKLMIEAKDQFDLFDKSDLVMDALFVSWGYKI